MAKAPAAKAPAAKAPAKSAAPKAAPREAARAETRRRDMVAFQSFQVHVGGVADSVRFRVEANESTHPTQCFRLATSDCL